MERRRKFRGWLLFFCDGHRSPARLFLPPRISTRNRTRGTNESRFSRYCIRLSFSCVSYAINLCSRVHASAAIPIYRDRFIADADFPLPSIPVNALPLAVFPSKYLRRRSFSFDRSLREILERKAEEYREKIGFEFGIAIVAEIARFQSEIPRSSSFLFVQSNSKRNSGNKN